MRQRVNGLMTGYNNIVPLEALAHLEPVPPPELAVTTGDSGREVGARIAATQAPAEMLAAIVRAYAVTLLKKPEVRTAEDRGRALKALRDLLDDAILDGIREVRPPEIESTPPPGETRRPRS